MRWKFNSVVGCEFNDGASTALLRTCKVHATSAINNGCFATGAKDLVM